MKGGARRQGDRTAGTQRKAATGRAVKTSHGGSDAARTPRTWAVQLEGQGKRQRKVKWQGKCKFIEMPRKGQ